MIERIAPALLYPENRFFLDYIGGVDASRRFFEHPPTAFVDAAEARRSVDFPRVELASRLRVYNEALEAPSSALANADGLAEPDTYCVVAGQQAGFLGGPLFAVYKILSVLHAASRLADRLKTRVVPIFWLASEDHDFTEINRVRIPDELGDLRTISFDWDGRGLPIERLPITPEIQTAMDEALDFFPEARAADRDLFLPDPSDDYATWHARIWSRLFGDRGLVLLEPRTVRPMAGPFFGEALALADKITAVLNESADELHTQGYAVLLDPEKAGGLFTFSKGGRRVRIADPASHTSRAVDSPERYSPDAALRPLLADSLLPTVANVLGSSEIAYQAMLNPLYHLFGIPQPIALPRRGYTLLTARQASQLERCETTVSDVLAGRFDPASVARSAVSPSLLEAFAERKADVRDALGPLLAPLEQLDPGLAARWRQTAGQIEQQIDRLEERAVQVDLARRGISLRELRQLSAQIRPAGKPQERVVPLIQIAAKHGLQWIPKLESLADPDEYAHYAMTLGESDE